MGLGRKVLAVDPGSRRLGVAVSDPGGTVALPLTVVERDAGWPETMAALVREQGAAEVVVGLPLRLDGSEGPAAEAARAVAAELADRLEVPVGLVDERMTTALADRALAAAGAGGRRRRGIVDRSAAAVLLQSYLDASGGA